jgi:hypothetical protein
MAILTRLFVRCRTWRCGKDISLDDVPGFYFLADELVYEGPPLSLTCAACGKAHAYQLSDVVVRRGADALR